jgi:hypothetical protein
MLLKTFSLLKPFSIRNKASLFLLHILRKPALLLTFSEKKRLAFFFFSPSRLEDLQKSVTFTFHFWSSRMFSAWV